MSGEINCCEAGKGRVRGPFLEFECISCGATVQANAPRNPDRLVETVADMNADPTKRQCAACWNPAAANSEDASPAPFSDKAGQP